MGGEKTNLILLLFHVLCVLFISFKGFLWWRSSFNEAITPLSHEPELLLLQLSFVFFFPGKGNRKESVVKKKLIIHHFPLLFVITSPKCSSKTQTGL